MANAPLSPLEAVLNSGKAIISADDDTIVALVKETIDSGRKATFYLSSAQSDAVRSWFFTLNANRRLVEICPNCDRSLRADDGDIEYDCDDYGGCRYQEVAAS
jgi:hypothetical protein